MAAKDGEFSFTGSRKRRAGELAERAVARLMRKEFPEGNVASEKTPTNNNYSIGSDCRSRDLRSLCHFLDISDAEVSLLPAARGDSRSLDDIPYGPRMAMVRLVANVARAAAEAVSSSLAEQILHCVGTRFAPSTASPRDNVMIQSVARYVCQLPKYSLEQRTSLALLCSSLKKSEAEGALLSFLSCDSSSPQQKRYSLTKKGFARAKDDAKLLANGELLQEREISRTRFDKESVRTAVDFILLRDNAKQLPYGGTTIQLGDRELSFPGLEFRYCPADFWSRFQRVHTNIKIGAHSFRRIVDSIPHITRDQKVSRDYVVQEYGVQTMATLLQAVDREIEDLSKKQELLSSIESCFAFVMSDFLKTVVHDSECAVHSSSYALRKSAKVPDHSSEMHACARCSSVFRTLLAVSSALQSTEGIQVAHESFFKVALLLAHKVRIAHQRLAIADAKASLLSHQAYVIVDYKMKVEPMKHQETSIDWFGKRGISLHGAAVRVGNEEGVQAYYDHVLQGSSAQDVFDTVCILEALLRQVKRDFPNVTEVILQSDNAPCYQSAKMWLAIKSMSCVDGIRIVRFLHTETQDGKTEVDAHFSVVSRALRRYVKSGYDVAVPSQVVYALVSDRGLKRTSVALLAVDRTKSQSFDLAIERQQELLGAKSRKSFGRLNDVYFHSNGDVSLFDFSGLLRERLNARNPEEDTVPADEAHNACSIYPPRIRENEISCPGFEANSSNDMHIGDIDLQLSHEEECDTEIAGEEREAMCTPTEIGDVHSVNDDADDSSGCSANDSPLSPFRSALSFTGSEIIHFKELKKCSKRWSCSPEKARGTRVECTDNSSHLAEQSALPKSITIDGLTCEDCRRSFSNLYRKNQHKCKGHQGKSLRAVDLTTFALQYAASRLEEGMCLNDCSGIELSCLPESSSLNLPFRFLPGWARRDSWAIGRRPLVVYDFNEDIREILGRESRSAGTFHSVERIEELLHRRYPDRLRFPSHAEIDCIVRTYARNGRDSNILFSPCIPCCERKIGDRLFLHRDVLTDAARRALLYSAKDSAEELAKYVTRDIGFLGYGIPAEEVVNEYISKAKKAI